MFQQLDAIFAVFRPCFSREATFQWCVIVIVGFYVRADHDGLTSMIRWLALSPSCYDALLHFFYAASWSVETLVPVWATWVTTACPLITFQGRPLLIGDGIKVPKEARKMPGVKAHHQASANNSKKATIWGHHWGVAGILTGSLRKAFCTPLRAELHEGVNELRPSEGLNGDAPTVVTRMARLLLTVADTVGCPCYAVLDAYFAVSPTFLILHERLTEHGTWLVHLITRAKDNTVAYFVPEPGVKRFRQKERVKLIDVVTRPDCFPVITTEVTLYGTATTISYCCLNLLWKPIDGLLRFVVIQHGEQRFILMSSDLTLPPLTIIEMYGFRTKIEVMFDVLKNLIGGFAYHFWTRPQPKLSRKKGWTPDITGLTTIARAHVLATLTAMERVVTLALLAVGILQSLSLTVPTHIWSGYSGWLRTYSSAFPSERIVKVVIATTFFKRARKVRRSRTFQIIHTRKRTAPVAHPPLNKEEKS